MDRGSHQGEPARDGAGVKLTGNRCRCQGCGEFFNSTSTFDRHRVGSWADRGATRRCLKPAEMRTRGWLLNAASFWIRGIRSGRPVTAGTARARAEISPSITVHPPQRLSIASSAAVP